MAEEHVEVNQVGEDESIVAFRPKFRDALHSFRVRPCRKRLRQTLTGKDVADFPDADHITPALANRVEHTARWLHRVIMPARRAAEVTGFASKWSCDDAADSMFIRKPTRDFADLI